MPDPPRPDGLGIAVARCGSDHRRKDPFDRDAVDGANLEPGQMLLVGHVFAQSIHLAVRHFDIEREKWDGLRDRFLNTTRGQNDRMPTLDLGHYRREQPVEFERAERPRYLLSSRVERTVHLGLGRVAV